MPEQSEEPSADARQLAREYGLDQLLQLDPGSVAKAFAAAARLKDAMPRDLGPSDEPAHVYRAGPEA